MKNLYVDHMSEMEVLFKELPISFYWTDVNGIILGCNNTLLKELDFNSPQDVIGKHVTELTNIVAWENSKKVMESQKTQTMEEAHIKENGEKIYYSSTKSPIFDKTGTVIGVVGISINITAKKHLEEELRTLKAKNEELSRVKIKFLEELRHDISTPLANVVGFANLIREGVTDKKLKEHAENLASSSFSLMNLLNQALESVRAISGKTPFLKQKFDLKETLMHVMRLAQGQLKGKKLTIQLKFDPKIPHYLIGDGKRISDIVLELVKNAIKFTQQGNIKITAALAKLDASEDNAAIKLSISDTGIGIVHNRQADIFTRLHRIEKNVGMGLTLVKQFIDDLDGEIYVDSWPNYGSIFTCIIPVQQVPVEEEGVIDLVSSSPAETCYRILIVEDQPLAAQVVESMLNNLACHCDVASTGKSAFDFLEKHNYDLIFMDIGLPDIDGREVTQQIRTQEEGLKRIPIVALTAHLDAESARTCISAGMDAVLYKPLLKEKAERVLSTFLHKQTVTSLHLNSAPIDLEMGSRIVGGDPHKAKDMIAQMLESVSPDIDTLKLAYQAQNWDIIREVVHRVRGTLAYCGTPRLQTVFTFLYNCLVEGRMDLAPDLCRQALSEMDFVKQTHTASENYGFH